MQFKRLEDFKDEVAVEVGAKNWIHLVNVKVNNHLYIDFLLSKASILYAKYIQEETIKRCSSKTTPAFKQLTLKMERILK